MHLMWAFEKKEARLSRQRANDYDASLICVFDCQHIPVQRVFSRHRDFVKLTRHHYNRRSKDSLVA